MALLHRLFLKRLGIVPTHAVAIRRNVRARMPDGTELLNDLYLGNTATRLVSMSRRSRWLMLRFLIPGMRNLLEIRPQHWAGLPLASLDEKVVGEPVAFWQDWMEHSTAEDAAADQYVYDPADPTPSIGGSALKMTPFSVDNTQLEARADVLTYTSEPFAQPRDIIGPVAAELYVSSTAASADFFVRLSSITRRSTPRR